MSAFGSGSAQSVLMLAYHFAPDNSSGTHRSLHFARALVDAGIDLTVVTAALEDLEKTDESLNELFPYPERIVRVKRANRLGDHYLRAKQAARGAAPAGDGVADALAPAAAGAPAPRRGPVAWARRQLAAWDDFPDAMRGWIAPATRAGVEAGRRAHADVVYVSGPPWSGVIAADRVARRLGKPLVTDFRDPFTRHTGRFNEYREAWCRAWAARAERRILRHARLALFATPGVRQKAEASYGGGASTRFHTILNGSDIPLNEVEQPLDPQRPLIFRHLGSLYRGRSLAPLVRGLARALERQGGPLPAVRVEQIGPHPIDVGELAGAALPASLEVEHVPEVPFREAVAKMQEPSVLVISQPATFLHQIPTKLFDYLCTGNPVLVLAPEDGDTWRVASGFARCVRIEQEGGEAAAADVLADLLARWQRGELVRARAVEDTAGLTKEALSREFVREIRAVAGAPAGGRDGV